MGFMESESFRRVHPSACQKASGHHRITHGTQKTFHLTFVRVLQNLEHKIISAARWRLCRPAALTIVLVWMNNVPDDVEQPGLEWFSVDVAANRPSVAAA